MAWFARKSPEVPGSADPLTRMPPVTWPSKTSDYTAQARKNHPADEHWSETVVVSYVELVRDRQDSPLFVGVSGRPAILLELSSRMRVGLDGLGEQIERKGADLYLQGHRLGQQGMLRTVLQLPERDLIFETPLTLVHGDVQEFISGAYQQEAVELHVAHANGQSLHFACRAAGVRPVVNAAAGAVDGLDHPTTPAQQAGPVSALEAKFPKISDGLTGRSRIRLTVTGPADGALRVETRN